MLIFTKASIELASKGQEEGLEASTKTGGWTFETFASATYSLMLEMKVK